MRRCAPVLLALACLVHAGCGEDPPEAIRLGAPLSTAYLYGWAAERGIRLAVEEINAAGGVQVGDKKLPFSLDVIDTRDLEPGVPVDDAIKAVERLILQKEVHFLVGGPVRSEAAMAVMGLVNRHAKLSIITTGVLSPAYHQAVAGNYAKHKYCFRITSDVITLGKDLMGFFEGIREEHGLDRVFVMVQDVAHAKKAGTFVKKLLEERGFSVVGLKRYPTGHTDFAPGLLESRRQKAQFIFIWMDMPESAILLKQWRDLRLKSLPVGFMSAAEQPGFWEASGGSAEYTVVNMVNGGNARGTITAWTPRFVKAYEERWGHEPDGYGASSSYMAVYAIKDAVERAGTLEPKAVLAAMEALDLEGVYGRIRFDPKSHQVIPARDPAKGVVGSLVQWQGGKRVTFWPEAAATGTLVLPPWMRD